MYGWPATVGLPHTTVLAAPGTTLLGAKLRSPSRMMFITVVGGSARAGRAMHSNSAAPHSPLIATSPGTSPRDGGHSTMEVTMRTVYTGFIIALFLASGAALSQTTGDPARGNTPPGKSQDGAGPADGAIKGGSIRPGESAGLPNTGGTAPSSEERLQRCEQLEGKLREDCLKDENAPASGASAPSIRRTPKEIDYLDREKPSTK